MSNATINSCGDAAAHILRAIADVIEACADNRLGCCSCGPCCSCACRPSKPDAPKADAA